MSATRFTFPDGTSGPGDWSPATGAIVPAPVADRDVTACVNECDSFCHTGECVHHGYLPDADPSSENAGRGLGAAERLAARAEALLETPSDQPELLADRMRHLSVAVWEYRRGIA